MTPDDMQKAVEAMQRLTVAMERTGQTASEIGKRVFKDWSDGIKDVDTKGHNVAKNLKEHLTDALLSPIKVASKTLKVYNKEIKETMDLLDKRMVRGADNAGGLFEGTRRVVSTMTSGFPMGGMFGFMLFGRMKQEEYKAKSQVIAQSFQNAGDVAKGTLDSMYSNVRRLETSIPGIAAAFDSGAKAAAAMGITASQSIEKVEHKLGKGRSDVGTMAVAMNKLFESGDGSTEKAAATLVQNTNLGYKESVELLNKMGAAVQNTGISYTGLLATVMQTTSALRMQGTSAESVAKTLHTSQAGLKSLGMNDARSGAIAASGVQGIAGAISGLNVGLKAVLGESMTGGRQTGLAASRKFDMGMLQGQKGGGADFNATIRAMLKMAEKAGGGNEDRMYHAIQALFNINTEGAATMMAIHKANKEGVPINKAIADNGKALKNSLDNEGLKQSKFETMMRELIELLARIGAGLLDALITGFKTSIAMLKYGFDWFMNGVSDSQTADLMNLLNASNTKLMTLGSNLWGQMKESKSLGQKFLDTVEGPESEAYKKASKDYYRDRTDEKKGKSGLDHLSPISSALEGPAKAYANFDKNFNPVSILTDKMMDLTRAALSEMELVWPDAQPGNVVRLKTQVQGRTTPNEGK